MTVLFLYIFFVIYRTHDEREQSNLLIAIALVCCKAFKLLNLFIFTFMVPNINYHWPINTF